MQLPQSDEISAFLLFCAGLLVVLVILRFHAAIRDRRVAAAAIAAAAAGNPTPPESSFKDLVGILSSVVTMLAIGIGGIWTYSLFIKERGDVPHANIEQKISHVSYAKGINVLRVAIEVNNTGKKKLTLTKADIRVQRVLPFVGCSVQDKQDKRCVVDQVNEALKSVDRSNERFTWPLLAHFDKAILAEIEPGEKSVVDFEFAVSDELNVVRVYSHVRNDTNTDPDLNFGWRLSDFYDFREPRKETAK